MSKEITQEEILKEFYTKNPHREIAHPEVVDWVTSEYKQRTGKIFRDPDRGIRKLAQKGYLIKVKKGVYKYDPTLMKKRVLEDFSLKQKKEIFERDGYKCVICGRGKEHGVELHVDHIKPKELGGEASIKNGQTLCAQHNYQKKIFQQTETGKKMFIRLYELAKEENSEVFISFCRDILSVFERYNINGHIEWEE